MFAPENLQSSQASLNSGGSTAETEEITEQVKTTVCYMCTVLLETFTGETDPLLCICMRPIVVYISAAQWIW